MNRPSAEVSNMVLGARTIRGLHDVVEEILLRQVELGAQILDLGGGTGAWARRLTGRGFRVSALERDLSGFRAAEIPVLQGDLNDGFAEIVANKFEAITAIEVIEHLENPRAFLRECMKCLKQDGYLIITTPNVENVPSRLRFLLTGELRMFGEDPGYNDPTHITPIFSRIFLKAARETGFVIVEHMFDVPKAVPRRSLMRLASWIGERVLLGPKGGDISIFVLKRLRA